LLQQVQRSGSKLEEEDISSRTRPQKLSSGLVKDDGVSIFDGQRQKKEATQFKRRKAAIRQ
jgi:hypothetical protein